MKMHIILDLSAEQEKLLERFERTCNFPSHQLVAHLLNKALHEFQSTGRFVLEPIKTSAKPASA